MENEVGITINFGEDKNFMAVSKMLGVSQKLYKKWNTDGTDKTDYYGRINSFARIFICGSGCPSGANKTIYGCFSTKRLSLRTK
jgi:hypothetical protein